ncbi:Mitochondrial transcription rescue factor 1 [Bulinus truncatus]|nr:Mitochondrial transcription rescue factor 1 [Bulinus truncatus]
MPLDEHEGTAKDKTYFFMWLRCVTAFQYYEPFTLPRQSILFINNKDVVVQKRQKSNKKGSESLEQDEEEDDLADDALDADDFEAPAKFKVIKIQVASLRSDTVISHALNIARNRMDEMFLGSSLLLNGEKMKKKAVKMDEGDYIDVLEKVEGQYKVKRVKLLKILPEKTANDKFIVKVRVWRTPFLLDQSVAEKRKTI